MSAYVSDLSPLEKVLAAGEERWQRHAEVLDWQPDYRIRGPEDPFSPAQEYLHHGHWLEYGASHVRAHLEGLERPSRIEDAGAQNDAWAAEDAHVPHQEAKVRAEAASTAYVDLVRRVGRTDDRFVNGVAGNLVQHLDQHFGYMVDGMLAHESARWENLTAVLDARPQGTLHQGEDGTAWSAALVYAHLERWMVIQFPRVEAFLATGEVPEDLGGTIDELNARWIREDRLRSFEDARRSAFLSRDRFVRTARDVPIERWKGGWCRSSPATRSVTMANISTGSSANQRTGGVDAFHHY